MPLIDREIIPWLKLTHGLYNTTVIILFFYQARLGITIRSRRKANAPLPTGEVKRHRKMGPVLTVLGIIGFFAGLTVVTLDEQSRYLEYWHHLFTGLAIILLLAAAYFVSKRIKGPDSPYRTPHYVIGILILCLYLLEAFLGLGVLF